jgi:transcription elongation factor Elf1
MPNSNTFSCPVCGFAGLSEPAYDSSGCASFEICPSCGTEFGYHDATKSHAELRKLWLDAGAPWRSQTTPPPHDWDALEQLHAAGLKGLEKG